MKRSKIFIAQKNDKNENTESIEKLKEENWGYFRPGFYPVQKDSIAPAMICLGEQNYHSDHNIQFILVKTDCYLNDWEDALLVSEKDYEQASKLLNKKESQKNLNDRLHLLTEQFISKGYLPLSQIIPDIQLNSIH